MIEKTGIDQGGMRLRLEQRHGKARVRVGRVWRNEGSHHQFFEWNVSISLLSDCLSSYHRDDNSNIVATDTMKNTVYVKAKECGDRVSVEEFAILVGKHFCSFYPQVFTAIVNILEKPWDRVSIHGKPHSHGFKLGSETHTTEATVHKAGALTLTSGIKGLALLKTTQSGFEGFVRDKYTILPETRERMLATEVNASWRYSFESVATIPTSRLYFSDKFVDVKKILMETFFGPPETGVYSPSVQRTLYLMGSAVLKMLTDVSSIHLKMPNIHFLPVNLSTKENLSVVKFEDDVYLPTDEPHGSIEATVSRLTSKM